MMDKAPEADSQKTCVDSKPLANGSLGLREGMVKEEDVDDPPGEEEDAAESPKEAKTKTTRRRRYPCGKCPVVSQSSANLKKHLMTHSGEKPYKCITCQKAFRQRHHLSDHRRTHTGERPFGCDQCGSRFVQRSSLNLHRKKHAGAKRYSCDVCGHATYERMHMVIHARTHTGEKPYQCDKCGRMFSNATRLRFHRMIHTGERLYKCDECGVSFREKVTLQKHRAVHINRGPFECHECGQEFSRLAGLSLHRKVHDKKDDYLYVFDRAAHEAVKTSRRKGLLQEVGSGEADRSLNASASSEHSVAGKEHDAAGGRERGAGGKEPNVGGKEHSGAGKDHDAGGREHSVGSKERSVGGTEHDADGRAVSREGERRNGVHASVSDQSDGHIYDEAMRNSIVLSAQEEEEEEESESSSQNRMKENLASSLREVVQNPVVHPDQVRAALESGTVLETQDEQGKGFYIVLPPSLKNKDITLVSDSNPKGSAGDSSPVLGNSVDHREPYENVVQEIDVRDYPTEEVKCGGRGVYDGVLLEEGPRYSQVVREELHADGASLLLWNDGLEHLTEVTYVIEEGSEDAVVVEGRSRGVEPPGDAKSKKRKPDGSQGERPKQRRRKYGDGLKAKKVRDKRVRTQKVYDCQQCGKACKTSSNYISHMRTHSGERPYFCDFCGLGFKQIAHLRSHVRIHTGERPYVCNVCGDAFTQSSRLNSHRRTKHGGGRGAVREKPSSAAAAEHKVRNFYCKTCEKTFINECFKIDHMRTHASREPHECKICGVRYKSRSSMVKHRLKHSDHKSICEVCGAGFLDLDSLRTHRIAQHEPPEGGLSDVCISVKIGEEEDFVVINRSIKGFPKTGGEGADCAFIDVTEAGDCQVKQEVIHVTDADGRVRSEVMPPTDFDVLGVKSEELEAPEAEGPCGAESASIVAGVKKEIEQPEDADSRPECHPPDMSGSVKDELGEKKYATFVNSAGRKIWVCKVCDKSFLQSSNLHSHMRMHTGERPFKCNACHRAFRQITHLKDHMSRHTGMKPYKCGECGSLFSQRSAVTRHFKTLHGEGVRVVKNDDFAANGRDDGVGPVCDAPEAKEEKVSRCVKGEVETPLECRSCEEVLDQRGRLESRELPHARGPHACTKCRVSFARPSALETHTRKCKGEEEEEEGTDAALEVKKHPCECGASFRLKSQLARHKKKCAVVGGHVNSAGVNELDESPGGRQLGRRRKDPAVKRVELKGTTDKPFTCKVCSSTLGNIALYKTHLKQHGQDAEQVCEDCGAIFRRASALRFHQSVKHNRIDDRYRDYSLLEQEDIKEEAESEVEEEEEEEGAWPRDIAGHSFSESKAEKMEENSDGKVECKGNTLKCTKDSDKEPTKIKGNRRIKPRKELVERDKPIRGGKHLKKNKRPAKPSRIVANRPLKESQKEWSETAYECQACGKVFSRSSKLKHHVAMWCKGSQDRSGVDATKEVIVERRSPKRVKQKKNVNI